MGLRISKLKPPMPNQLPTPAEAPTGTAWPQPAARPALPIPEPYATKANALLKPWHPLLEFELGFADGDLTFSIRLRNLLSRDIWTHDAFKRPVHHGMFPTEAFEKDPAAGAERFELFVFRALVQFVAGLIDFRGLTGLQLVRAGVIDWPSVQRWIGWLTQPLAPWFDLHPSLDDDALSVLALQTTAEMGVMTVPGWLFHDVGHQVRPWHAVQPAELVSLPLAAINQECLEIAAAGGDAKAEALLRKLVLEKITNSLYFLRFAV